LGVKEVLLLRLAKKWISGVDLDSALKDARDANQRGLNAVINFLGEGISDPTVADSQLQQYLSLEQAISQNGIRGYVSVKLTQFGLAGDEAGAQKRLQQVVAEAALRHQLLWIDMEASEFLPKTLEIYSRIREGNAHIGVALQSYIRRSETDLKNLLEIGARVRLVKGAYKEPPDIVFASRAETSKNFSKLMKMLFEQGDNFVIATHDPKLIEEAKTLAESSHAAFEFQMLKGIQDGLKGQLANSGYKVGEYLPYGDQWYEYSKRRITEHPSNILLLLRSLL
jgi:proline dehydrogenase